MNSVEELIAAYYQIETAVVVSPHALRGLIDRNDSEFVLIDVRSRQEYEKEHIRSAVNIPAYSDPNTPAYEQVERIVAAFAALPEKKDKIVYCYSAACMSGRKVGKILAENKIYVRHLGIGWNEWRHHWAVWNHEHEWSSTSVENYISSADAESTGSSSAIGCDC